MVVFDEDGVEQAGAMVAAAAAVDGVFFEPAPAGRCFAGVVNMGRGAFDAADVLARERGDSGQAADEIQKRPLAGEHVAGGACEFGEELPAATSSPSFTWRPTRSWRPSRR